MLSGYHSASHQSTNGIVDLDNASHWPAAAWTTAQLDHQNPPCFSNVMPRSMQRDLAEIDLALANDDGITGPSAMTSQIEAAPMFNFDCHFSPMPMARTTSDTSGYRPAHPPHHHQHMQPANVNRKRDFHQIDMGLSQTYSHNSIPWPQQPRVDEVQVYEPGDYCSKLANEASVTQVATKKQRVDSFDENQLFAWSSSYAPNMCVPSAHDVAPSADISTSKSTHLSPCSLTSSEDLSRHSSVSSASVNDAFDMMRVESTFSTASDLFRLDGPFVSCATTKPVCSKPITGLNEGSVSHLLGGVGYVGADAFSFFGQDLSAAPVAVRAQYNPSQPKEHTAVGENASNDEQKESQRRRKHIDNSRQCIAPKRSSTARAARSPKSQNPSAGSQSQEDSTPVSNLPSTTSGSAAQKKEAISKTPYVRPQHPKLYCNMCEDSSGFRGDHELRRHWDREHAQRRKVWICLQPTTPSEWWPAKPLSSCKQCKQQKQYNVYYNAAAHLRRAHFCPRKRGRKAKGEQRESRAGKAGGDWPPIDWLKANGWLKEIEVSSTQTSTPAETPLDSSTPEVIEERSVTQIGAFAPPYDSFAQHYAGLVNTAHVPTQWHDADVPVPMQETVSAPASFPSTAAMSLYVANGYAF